MTAHRDRALRAFELQALDYVTKPLQRARLREAVSRARERIRLGRLDQRPEQSAAPPSADDDHVVVHTPAKTWRARETLQEIGARLDPFRFVRIHRSTIVRLLAIRELQPWFHGDYIAILHGGTKLRLSRTYRDRVARLLGREV